MTDSETSNAGSKSFWDSLKLLGRVLIFRATRDDLLNLNKYDLVLGLFFTWVVGMGRYWDNSKVEMLQKMGVGSIIYVFALTTFLYLIIWLLRPKNWNWYKLLIFITLTSPPGLLYAIPVHMIFYDPIYATANSINVWFLGIVSVWRISLMIFYLRRSALMNLGIALLALSLPIMILITSLAFLNLEKVVFNIMGGIETSQLSPNDGIYEILMFLVFLNFYLIIPFLIGYISCIYVLWKKPDNTEAPETASDNPTAPPPSP